MINGYREARKFLKKYKPDVVFSKGGFVSVPVVRAAGSLHIPCVIHESDMTPGLANKLCFRAAKKICCNFPETLEMLPKGKAVLTGTPIRGELFTGDKARGLEICGFTADKPVLMIMGGSQGSVSVNNAVRGNLPELLETFQIVHLCGKGHFDESLGDVEGYCQFEYVKEDLKHLFAAADLLVSRAGANAICEILALGKPSLLIPLPTKGSRGDQILNANSFAEQGFSEVLEDEKASDQIVAKVTALSSPKSQPSTRIGQNISRPSNPATRLTRSRSSWDSWKKCRSERMPGADKAGISSPKSQPSTRIGQNISRPSNPATRLTRSRSSWDFWKKCRSERMPGADETGISLGNYLSRHFARQLFKPALRPAAI